MLNYCKSKISLIFFLPVILYLIFYNSKFIFSYYENTGIQHPYKSLACISTCFILYRKQFFIIDLIICIPIIFIYPFSSTRLYVYRFCNIITDYLNKYIPKSFIICLTILKLSHSMHPINNLSLQSMPISHWSYQYLFFYTLQ